MLRNVCRVVSVLLVAVAIMGACGRSTDDFVESSPPSAGNALLRFIEAVRDEEWQDLEGRVCTSTLADLNSEEFGPDTDLPVISGAQAVTSLAESWSTDDDVLTLSPSVTIATIEAYGRTGPDHDRLELWEFQVIREGGRWRVCDALLLVRRAALPGGIVQSPGVYRDDAGSVRVVFGQCDAVLQEVSLRRSRFEDPIWHIQRADEVARPDEPSEEIVVGEVPQGFEELVPLTGDISTGALHVEAVAVGEVFVEPYEITFSIEQLRHDQLYAAGAYRERTDYRDCAKP